MTSDSPSTADAHPFRCDICDKGFRRQEHLVRHGISHTRNKPHRCLQCGKSFARRDTLDRHVLVHEQNATSFSSHGAVRACQPCAAGRVRCSRGLPCSQCDKKGRKCTYPGPNLSRKAQTPNLLSDYSNLQTHTQVSHDSFSNATADLQPAAADSAVTLPITNNNVSAPILASNEACLPHDSNLTESFSHYYGPGRFVSAAPEASFHNGYEYTTATSIGCSINWWSPESQNTENWVLDQVLMSDWQFPALGMYMENSQSLNEQGFGCSEEPAILEGVNRPKQHSAAPDKGSPFAETFKEMASNLQLELSSPTAAPGKYYAEGSGGRVPFPGNANTTSSLPHSDRSCAGTAPAGRTSNGTPAGTTTHDPAGNVPNVDVENYALWDQILSLLVTGLRGALPQHSLDFSQGAFPSARELGLCIRCYFEKFHPIFPFLSRPEFDNGKLHWLVVLAVAATGAHLRKSPHKTYLHSLLAKVLQMTFFAVEWFDRIINMDDTDNLLDSSSDALPTIQAAILNLIMMVQNGSTALIDSALVERGHLVERCETMGLLNGYSRSKGNMNGYPAELQVQTWVRSQARLRAGLMIWLLDTMLAYQTDGSFRITSLGVVVALPSSETVWDNPSLAEIEKEETSKCFMLNALERIWINKSLPSKLSRFSNVLLVHAIYRRVQDVALQNQTRLSTFIPRSATQGSAYTLDSSELNPSTNEMYNKWRNSACDSLDVMHWSVNAQIAECGGWEHPCVSYLHLSRLLLLSPVTYLQSLAADPLVMREDPTGWRHDSKDMFLKARPHVIRWAIQDRFKARLCLIHAGALYWHIRRYGVGGIVEPFGIYLATLVLWAYSVVLKVAAPLNHARSQSRAQEQSHENVESQDEPNSMSVPLKAADSSPTTNTPFLYLDRPCDDEMVQIFVREGHLMTAFVQGVGSIAAPGAPKKILQEGMRLLEAIGSHKATQNITSSPSDTSTYVWEVQRHYIESLAHLETISE